MAQATDVQLVQRARQGDAEAFGEIVRRYQGAVYGLAVHLVHDFTDAQDVAQQVFIRAYERLAQLRQPEKLPAWLRQITYREAASWHRQRWEWLSLEDLPPDETVSNSVPSPAEEYDRKALREAVWQALRELSEKNRLAVTLYYIDGLTQQEVADFLGVSRSVVANRLQRARHQLKEKMMDLVEDTLKEHALPDGFAEGTLREALEKAKSAQEQKAYREVVTHCDTALEALTHLPEDEKHKRHRKEALRLKAHAVRFPLGVREALPYLEEALELERELGDQRSYAQALVNFSADLSNAGEKDRSHQAREQARQVFAAIGDRAGEAECLLWLGSEHFSAGDATTARSFFEPAQELFTGTEAHDMAAVCWAALQVVAEAGEEPGLSHLLSRCAVCTGLEKTATTVAYRAELGFSTTTTRMMRMEEGLQAGFPLFYQVGQMRTLLDLTKSVGDTWSADVFSYSFTPLKAVATVESNTETVSVPAGTFSGCLKLRLEITENPEDPEPKELNRINCGVKQVWFAPGVGLVRFAFDRADGVPVRVELANYRVADGGNDYLPLAVGNRWEYQPAGVDSAYVSKNVHEVRARVEDVFYVGNYAYAYYTGSDFDSLRLLAREAMDPGQLVGALEDLEPMYAERGQAEDFPVFCREVQQERRGDPVAEALAQWYLEPGAPAPEFAHPAFTDDFTGPELDSAWQWNDPTGQAGYTFLPDGGLGMDLRSRCDLYPPGGRTNAPRLLRPVSGDFAVELRLRLGEKGCAGGLLIWQDEQHFLLLAERARMAHELRFVSQHPPSDPPLREGGKEGYHTVGRGRLPVDRAWLRLERQGNAFRAWASPDRETWFHCGHLEQAFPETVSVGLFGWAEEPEESPRRVTLERFALMTR